MIKKFMNYPKLLILGISCTLLSFLYSQVNVGGAGWLVPSNVMMWTIAVIFIGLSVYRGFYLNRFYVSNLWLVFGGMLFVLILFSLLNTKAAFIDIAVYGLAMLVVWLFVGALQQYRSDRKELIQLAFIVAFFAFLQAIISLVQIADSYKVLYQLTGYYPFKFSGRPVGTFQQVNMLASFLAFGLVMIFYLLTSPIKLWGSKKQRWLLVVMSVAIFYVLLISGSRAGLLGFVFGVAWIILFRYKAVLALRNWVLIWFIALSIGLVFSFIFAPDNTGLSVINSKLVDVMNGSDIRGYLYASTFRMFLEGPLLGYGLDGFNSAYLAFIKNDSIPKALADVSFTNFTHPHNEILFWMIQSGVFGLLAIVVFAVFYLKVLWKYSITWGLILIGLASPLIIQSQLSYPFSLSAPHLFLFLVLLTFGMKGRHRKIMIGGSKKLICLSFIKKLSAILILTIIGFTFYFSWLTLKGIKDAYYFDNRLFLYKNDEFAGYETQGYFKYASQQPMFTFMVNHAMQEMAKTAFKKNNSYDMKQYVLWSENSWLKDSEINKNNYKNSILLERVYLELGDKAKASLLSQRNKDSHRLHQTDENINLK